VSTERSDRVYFSYLEASQRFDYFVVGASLALVGYLGSAYSPARLGWNSATIELAAIALLLFSAIAGLKRIETSLTLLAGMQRRLRAEETAGTMAGVATSGTPALNKATGEILWPADALEKAQRHKVGAEVIAKKLDSMPEWSGRWYRIRNLLLILGLALLVLARVSEPYIA